VTATTRHLSPLISEALAGVRHGFFTRKGGASSGVFEGLNCGYGSSDQREIVSLNRARVAAQIGIDAGHLLTVHQTHSADVLRVDGPLSDPRPQADAMVTTSSGLGLAILTADCQPVLLADAKSHVIGAAHAGWRGALDGILEATVEAMIQLGARRDRIVATIGPSISQRAYEVGEEFFDRFLTEDPENALFFANGVAGKFQFDLPSYGLSRLRAAGIGAANWTGHCTYSAPELFFSYRRSVHRTEADYGRLISVVRL